MTIDRLLNINRNLCSIETNRTSDTVIDREWQRVVDAIITLITKIILIPKEIDTNKMISVPFYRWLERLLQDFTLAYSTRTYNYTNRPIS